MKFMHQGIIKAMAAFAMLAATAGTGVAFPDKPVTIIVGYGAGGGVDAISRTASKTLSAELGQPVVVQNRPGAGGGLAVTGLKSTAADGYTLVATTSTTLTFDPHAKDVAFSVDDFEYIAAFGVFPEAFVALPGRGWKTFSDTLAEAKGKPEGLNYASTTSIDRVIMAAIAKKEGVTIKPVPTKGGAEAVAQVLGGHVDFAYSSGTYYAHAKTGDLHILAGLGEKRISGFPETATLRELGYDTSSVNMVLFLAPKGIPEEAKTKLVAAFRAAGKADDVLALLAKRNMGDFVPVGDEISKAIHMQSDQFKAALE
jgi:tripartite-type tricarboxylate transporter receptor subunit TctC